MIECCGLLYQRFILQKMGATSCDIGPSIVAGDRQEHAHVQLTHMTAFIRLLQETMKVLQQEVNMDSDRFNSSEPLAFWLTVICNL
jgi:hypothetical protein